MEFIKRWFRGSEKRAVTWEQLAALGGWIDSPTKSNVTVTEKTALGLSALYCGLKTISDDVGTLEPVLYFEKGDNRERAKNHAVYDILCDEPNQYQTRPVFWSAYMHRCLLGNGLAEIERNNAGDPIALHLIDPATVEYIKTETGHLQYKIGETTLEAKDVLHVPGFSPDGSVGYKLLKIARETFGFGLAAQEFGAKFFANGCRPSGTLNAPGGLTEQAYNNLQKSKQDLYGGTANVGKIMLLEEGVTFNPLMFGSNEQNQYKELLNFFNFEVARFLNIPSVLLHEVSRNSWGGTLYELKSMYLTNCLRPWLIKLEHEIEKKLLTREERYSFYCEFDTSSLLRIDTDKRYASYAIGLSNKFLTVDEVRAMENLPPLPPELAPQEPPAGPQEPIQPQEPPKTSPQEPPALEDEDEDEDETPGEA